MTILRFIGYAKKFCIALVAALTILGAAVADNTVTPAEYIQIAVAFLGALGVYSATNEEN
jgi:hypothetical protein